VQEDLQQLYETVQGADVAPTPQADAAITERMQALHALLARWSTERSTEVEAFDRRLRAAGR
jgi:hypothetical protein